MKFAGFVLILTSLAGGALAVAVDVPEIDGNSLGAGMVLVSGLLLVARGRRK